MKSTIVNIVSNYATKLFEDNKDEIKNKFKETSDEHFKTAEKSTLKDIAVSALVTAVVGEIVTGGLGTPLFLTVGACAVAGYFLGKKIDEMATSEKEKKVDDLVEKIKANNVVEKPGQTMGKKLALAR